MLQWLLHHAVMVLVGGGGSGCSWMLLLHPLPTCADTGPDVFCPDLCTLRSDFAPCTCGVLLLSNSTSTPLAHIVVVTGYNLHWWHFSFSHWRKHSLHRWWCHPLQLALVVYIPKAASVCVLHPFLLHALAILAFSSSPSFLPFLC